MLLSKRISKEPNDLYSKERSELIWPNWMKQYLAEIGGDCGREKCNSMSSVAEEAE